MDKIWNFDTVCKVYLGRLDFLNTSTILIALKLRLIGTIIYTVMRCFLVSQGTQTPFYLLTFWYYTKENEM